MPARPYRWSDTPLDPFAPEPKSRRPKRNRAWLTWTVVIAVVVLGLAVANQQRNSDTVAVTPSVSDSVLPPPTSPPTTPPPDTVPTTVAPPSTEPAAPPPPAVVGIPLDVGPLTVTVTTWEVVTGQGFLGSSGVELVARVTLTNNGSSRANYSALDWEIQHPSGNIEQASPSLRPDELSLSGALAPGGSVTGTVAFDLPTGAAGEHLVRYTPWLAFAGTGSVAWTIHVS